MKITVKPITESKRVLDKCRLTVNKEPSKNPRPSTVFLDNIYMSEHSPIREKFFDISKWRVIGNIYENKELFLNI